MGLKYIQHFINIHQANAMIFTCNVKNVYRENVQVVVVPGGCSIIKAQSIVDVAQFRCRSPGSKITVFTISPKLVE